MNVVVAGEHAIALQVMEALMAKHQVVYVGERFNAADRFDRLDIEAVFGPITSPESLRLARVDQCDAFIACSDSDEQNIVACLAAQGLGAKRTTCVLHRSAFLRISDDDHLAETLGISEIIRPAQQLADEIVRIANIPGALEAEDLAGGRIQLLRCEVEEGAQITRGPLKQLQLPRGVLLVAVRRPNGEHELPSGSTTIASGDQVVVMGRRSSLNRFLPKLGKGDNGRLVRQATIVGAGAVGASVGHALEDAGWRIKLIESDRERCDRVAPKFKGLVLHGDGADIDLLDSEHVDDTPVLIAVTNNDEKNLLVSLLAKQMGVERIITRARQVANERVFEKVGIDVVRSAHGTAVHSIVKGIDKGESLIRAELEHGDARILELTLPRTFPVTLLAKLRPPVGAVVGAVLRGRKVIVPDGKTKLRPDDHLLVFCMRADEQQVREYFTEPETWEQLGT